MQILPVASALGVEAVGLDLNEPLSRSQITDVSAMWVKATQAAGRGVTFGQQWHSDVRFRCGRVQEASQRRAHHRRAHHRLRSVVTIVGQRYVHGRPLVTHQHVAHLPCLAEGELLARGVTAQEECHCCPPGELR